MAYLSAQLSFDIKSFMVYIVTESTCTCRIKLPGKRERGANLDLKEGDNVEAAIKASVGSDGLEGLISTDACAIATTLGKR